MCAQVDCPLQQAAPSRRECHRNRPRQSLLSPDFGYAPAAAACASEPGVLSHYYGPSPVAACICEPRVSCEPGVSELGACCMRQWARRFSDWTHPTVTLTPAQSLSAYWGGTHCPLYLQAGLEASPAGGGGWAGARETQTSAPHRASSVGIGAQGGASACAGSSLARDIVRCLMIVFNSAGAQCARDWARRALAPTPGASRSHAP